MRNHHWKKIAAVMLAAAIGIQPVYVQAKTREEIQQEREQKKSEQQGTQSQYKQSQSKVSSLEGQQDALEEEIQELDSQLVEVIASVSLMQDQISDTEKQIVKAQEDYDVAKAQEDAQYLAMKKRLRYLYEKGDTSYIEILSNASNWSGMLNQANYVEKLYEYDKQMLNRYILIKEEVAQKKNDLEDKKSDLETQKYELEEEQASMQQMIDEKKSQAMPGRFSVYNALTAIAICRHFKVSEADICKALLAAKVKGRIEMVKVSNAFTLMIDYAHNAMALKSLLTTLKEYEHGRLVCVFGCGGNRSRERRFEMGEVSGNLADFTIITSDNPRFEEPEAIIEDIITGMKKTDGVYISIPDRKEAIAYAIDHGQPGDIIVLAGKGHEDYQEIKGVKYPMDERDLIADILKERGISF